MLEREHFEVDRDAGKSQVTSKHESKSQAQRFMLWAVGGRGFCLGAEKIRRAKTACKSHRLIPVRCTTKERSSFFTQERRLV